MENEPSINLNVLGAEVEAKRDNTTLYTFLGKLACYNHIFVVTDKEASNGFYIFNDLSVYEEMANYMFENDYPMHLNLPEVAECDNDAWNRHIHDLCNDDLENGVPEEWENGTDTLRAE